MSATNRKAARGLLFPDDVKASGGGCEGEGADLLNAPVPVCHGVVGNTPVGNTPVGNTPVEFRYQPVDGAKPRDITGGCVSLAAPEMPMRGRYVLAAEKPLRLESIDSHGQHEIFTVSWVELLET
ncbi:predicted protein [Histoplasma mississippiense (nom. inval.)]|uniref:predicted protein n=1 Tax=Ajellomyces capsulatus (strain NAm1 / WU24) TaxID=2059318 RepID=UPI000157B936|nr:predicted protein [Histoplasma mississippiense (nom. inval.)]EDN03779.1 predicted protein [Histoplasma mississippiense (nom. inval.)]